MAKHITVTGANVEVNGNDSGISTFAVSDNIVSGNITTQLRRTLEQNNMITEVFYENSSNLIFSTPISSKVIRIVDGHEFYYGDEWTSRTTITNSKQFGELDTNRHGILDIFCDKDFLVIQNRGSDYYSITYIGKLSNGDEVALGVATTHNSFRYRGNNIYNISRDNAMNLVLLDGEFTNNGYIFKQNIYVVDINGELLMDGDTPVEVVGLENASIKTGVTKSYNLGTHYLTPAPLYAESAAGLVGNTSLLIELN